MTPENLQQTFGRRASSREVAAPFDGRRAGDGGLGDVVEHETELRMPVHQRDGRGHLRRFHQQVVAEAVRGDSGEAGVERGVRHIGVGLALQNVAHALELFFHAQLIEQRADLRVGQWHPADDALDEGVPLRVLEQLHRFLQDLPGLHHDGAVETDGGELRRSEVGRIKIAPDGAHVVADPVEFLRRVAPEVMMGVDLHAGTMIRLRRAGLRMPDLIMTGSRAGRTESRRRRSRASPAGCDASAMTQAGSL